MTREFELLVDTLVLEGLPAPDHARFGAALQAEFERLLAEEGLPLALERAGGDLAFTQVGPLTAPTGVRVEALGAQVARALYKGLCR